MNNILALFLTIILEIIVILLFRKKLEIRKIIGVSIIINSITNIILNLILGLINDLVLYIVLLSILEVTVLVVEGLVYSYFIKDKKVAYLLSLICNLLSFVVGTALLNIILLIV